MTSVARHSERSLTIVLSGTSGEANVCTPRPTSSRVTTADGRSPGSRVDTLRRLPRTEIPSGIGRKIHRLQLRGQPRHWGSFPAPHSLLIPKQGNRREYLEFCRPKSQCRRLGEPWSAIGYAFCSDAACARPQSLYEHWLMRRRCRLRTIDEHSERHADG